MSETETRQRLAAILMADVAGYSRLMNCDERGTVAALDNARAVFRTTIDAHRGRVIDMAGDSVLAVFETASGAVVSALAIQAELARRSADVAADCRMQFRIGIHLGDVMEKADGTVYGDGVNIAARLEGIAEPGGVTVSDAVQCAVRQRLDATFDDLGEQRVKNIAAPVRAYRVLERTRGGERRRRRDASRATPPARPAPKRDRVDKPSIAVLPFDNMSGDPEQEFFADGITEDIITELSRFRELFVISRNSSFKFKGKPVEVQKFARELGVQYVVEGSVRKAGRRVRITVQLIDAETDRHLWAERYDRDLEDIFAIQDEVTTSIVATLPGRVEAAARDRAARTTTDNMAAYECVLTGKVLHHRSNRDDNAKAQRLLERAIELDPSYAHAHAWKACVLGQTWVYNWCESRPETQARIMESLQAALALDDNDCDVHRILAAINVIQDNHDQAVVPPAARAEPQSERRPRRRPAGRDPDLARPAGRGHRLDQEGDAPQSVPPGALLEPPRARLLRGAPLRRGGRCAQVHQQPRRAGARRPGRVPRPARRRRGGRGGSAWRRSRWRRRSRSPSTWRRCTTATRRTASTTGMSLERAGFPA